MLIPLQFKGKVLSVVIHDDDSYEIVDNGINITKTTEEHREQLGYTKEDMKFLDVWATKYARSYYTE